MVPRHVAIIMDGNGRWAKQRGKPRIFGHIRGSARARDIINYAGKLGVEYLTLYAFSTENWGRSEFEVATLMRLLEKYLIRERKTLITNNVRFNVIGGIDSLPLNVQKVVKDTINLTSHHTGLNLTFALSYGSRQEILQAVKKMLRLPPEDINEEVFSQALQTSSLPDPDLIIRTSGESRISNFMLWQAAYSELYFTPVLWPDFTPTEFERALGDFSRRNRRYGLAEVSP